jgi:hypothetical protein
MPCARGRLADSRGSRIANQSPPLASRRSCRNDIPRRSKRIIVDGTELIRGCSISALAMRPVSVRLMRPRSTACCRWKRRRDQNRYSSRLGSARLRIMRAPTAPRATHRTATRVTTARREPKRSLGYMRACSSYLIEPTRHPVDRAKKGRGPGSLSPAGQRRISRRNIKGMRHSVSARHEHWK